MRFPVLLLSLFLTGCGSSGAGEEPDKPDEILDKQQLKEVLVDLFLTEATLGEVYLPGDTVRTGIEKVYSELFSNHQTNPEQFVGSLHYYSLETKQMLPLMEQVMDSLNALGNPSATLVEDDFTD
jgi:hypothetical protein